MRARVPAKLLVATLLLAAPVAVGPVSGTQTGLRLAILPCTNIETTFRKFHPLLSYLRSATGIVVTLVVPADLAEFEAMTTNDQVDFALQDPHTFQQLSQLFDDDSLLQTVAVDATTGQSGGVVVRRESGVTDLAQLHGRTVMFGPRTSSPKWVAARLLFESRGIAVERDLRWVNGGCCEDIAFAVSIGSVDAGVICDHFLGLHAARQRDLGIDPRTLVVIGRTPVFPTRILAARRGVPGDTVAAVTVALLKLDPANPAQAPVLASAEIRGFVRTTEAAYLKGLARPATRGRP